MNRRKRTVSEIVKDSCGILQDLESPLNQDRASTRPMPFRLGKECGLIWPPGWPRLRECDAAGGRYLAACPPESGVCDGGLREHSADATR
ncbi:hypothetical protein AAFF_G00162940 [Aldrovandia affinis]|uniref:Uncharacterized protein n=1 Tax=Aldrovandia affinis TaxID=143900 RepID=A0AAD7T184_9TELE|nr:hypothetical protein AAFF_G00162940 [Aldrovandia affinis]